jgi:valyl-tRNA synthetase
MFCDQYLELVKQRAYGQAGPEGQASAAAALTLALSSQLRLLAPVLPFVTEEVWSWWRHGSVHRAAWPTAGELATSPAGDPGVLDTAAVVLGEVRRAKTEAKRSLRTVVTSATVTASAATLAALDEARSDVMAAGAIEELTAIAGEGSPGPDAPVAAVEVMLAPDDGD